MDIIKANIGEKGVLRVSRKYMWLLCGLFAAWTLMIFTRSMQPAPASNQESEAVLELLQRIFPVELTMYQIRKAAHFLEFAVLGVLAQLMVGGLCRSRKRSVLFAVVAGLVIALCDETIQLFVLGRTGQVKDIWLDLSGAISGALIACVLRFLVQRKGKRV